MIFLLAKVLYKYSGNSLSTLGSRITATTTSFAKSSAVHTKLVNELKILTIDQGLAHPK